MLHEWSESENVKSKFKPLLNVNVDKLPYFVHENIDSGRNAQIV